eukprot:6210226-Pleurochrysis_carterae.AAC.3
MMAGQCASSAHPRPRCTPHRTKTSMVGAAGSGRSPLLVLLIAAVSFESLAAFSAPSSYLSKSAAPRQLRFGSAAHSHTAYSQLSRGAMVTMEMQFSAVVSECEQELIFIIHADGRVEERVQGVKGANCQKVTQEIEQALGEVYQTEATQEMYEQVVEVENTVSQTWGASDEKSGEEASEW